MFAEQPQRMTQKEYLAWEELQERKHELVDGSPVDRWRLRGMAGGTARHNRLALNIITALTNRLTGGPCEPFGSDVKVRTPKGNHRYPDVVVQCGPFDDAQHVLPAPRVVFEVLSPSNTIRNQLKLMDDYQAIPSILQIALVDQRRPYLVLSTRREDWERAEVEGLDASLSLDSIGAEIPLSEIYARTSFLTEPG